jgi:ATP-dependent Clp protease adaptor protein ClpS
MQSAVTGGDAPRIQQNTAAPDRESDIDVEIGTTVWVEPPFRVLIHNDDVTTFEFVIGMLKTVFKIGHTRAESIARITHVHGLALVCVRPQGEAERLVNQAIFAARLDGFPLMLTCEPE